MHIQLILSDVSFRGGERLFAELAKGFLQEGHQVSVVAGRVNKNSRSFPPQAKVYAPLPVINEFFQNTFLFVLFSLPLTFFRLFLHSRTADVMYTTESFLSVWPAVIVSQLYRKKLILAVFELGNTSEIHPAMPVKKLFTAINTFFVKRISYAISINQALVPVLQKRYQIAHTTWIPAGIDTTIFTQTKSQKKHLHTKKIILMPGVLHPIKNHALAIEIIERLKQTFPGILLLITGNGPNAYLASLKTLIRRKKLQQNIRFTGVISDTELRDFYEGADIVLHCGPIAGLTIIEALLMNKMPLYPTSGIPPQGPVEAFGIGLIIREKTSAGYVKIMSDYLHHPAKYKKKLQKDHEFVLKTFSLPNVIKKTLRFIES
jgi:glycosyltransferase involved in cell wall biosynthesis